MLIVSQVGVESKGLVFRVNDCDGKDVRGGKGKAAVRDASLVLGLVETPETRNLVLKKSRDRCSGTNRELEFGSGEEAQALSQECDSSLRFSPDEVVDSADGMVLKGWTVRGSLPAGVSSVEATLELVLEGINLEGGASVRSNIAITSGTALAVLLPL